MTEDVNSFEGLPAGQMFDDEQTNKSNYRSFIIMEKSIITLAAALAVAVSAHAAEVIKPEIGEPLRDAAV